MIYNKVCDDTIFDIENTDLVLSRLWGKHTFGVVWRHYGTENVGAVSYTKLGIIRWMCMSCSLMPCIHVFV